MNSDSRSLIMALAGLVIFILISLQSLSIVLHTKPYSVFFGTPTSIPRGHLRISQGVQFLESQNRTKGHSKAPLMDILSYTPYLPSTVDLCIIVPSVFRFDEQHIHKSLGALLDTLTPKQRSRIHLALFTADKHPKKNLQFIRRQGLHRLVDVVLKYPRHTALPSDWIEKQRLDFIHSLKYCSRTLAPYSLYVEDDAVATDHWYSQLTKILRQIQKDQELGDLAGRSRWNGWPPAPLPEKEHYVVPGSGAPNTWYGIHWLPTADGGWELQTNWTGPDKPYGLPQKSDDDDDDEISSPYGIDWTSFIPENYYEDEDEDEDEDDMFRSQEMDQFNSIDDTDIDIDTDIDWSSFWNATAPEDTLSDKNGTVTEEASSLVTLQRRDIDPSLDLDQLRNIVVNHPDYIKFLTPAYAEAYKKLYPPPPNWIYLRLFYTEQLMGFENADIPYFILFGILVALTQIAFWSWKLPAKGRDAWYRNLRTTVFVSIWTLLVVATAITIPLLCGKQNVFPVEAGLTRRILNRCCSPAFLFPTPILANITQAMEDPLKNAKYPGDILLEMFADDHDLIRYAWNPSLFQHVSLSSPRTDSMEAKNDRPFVISLSFELADKKA